jgi:PAS domain-containing protein
MEDRELEMEKLSLEISELRKKVVMLEQTEAERKRAEEEVRKLSRAVSESPSLIIITDREGNIDYVNPKFTEVTGYSSEEVLGENARLLKSGETPDEVYAEMWRSLYAAKEWRG